MPERDGIGRSAGTAATGHPDLAVAVAVAILRDTDPDLVGALVGVPPGWAAGAMARLCTAGSLTESLPPPGTAHPLDRALGPLPADQVARLRRYAARLLDEAGRPATQVADQLLSLPTGDMLTPAVPDGPDGMDDPAVRDVLCAAAARVRAASSPAAARYLARLCETVPDDAEARCALADALLGIDPAASTTHLRHALDAHPDDGTRARLVAVLGQAALRTGQPDGSSTDLSTETVAPDDRGVLDAVATLLARPAGSRPHGGYPPPRPGSPADQLATTARAVTTALTVPPGDALGSAVGDARRALGPGPGPGGWTTGTAARVLALADHLGEALGRLDDAITAADRLGEPWAACHARSVRAFTLLETGALDAATADARAAVAAARRGGWPALRGLPLVTIAVALLLRDRPGPARRILDRLAGEPPTDPWTYPRLLLARGLAHWRTGDVESAAALLHACDTELRAAGVDNPVLAPSGYWHSLVLTRLGRAGEARERSERLADLAGRWPTPRATGLALLAAATTATARERVDLLVQAENALARGPDPFLAALAGAALGRAQLGRDDPGAARPHLRAALALAERHGYAVLAGPTRGLLARAGGRPRRLPADALTAGERSVAALAATGASNREIARTLYLTVRTVEFHLTNVYRKLGVTRRGDLTHRLPPTGTH